MPHRDLPTAPTSNEALALPEVAVERRNRLVDEYAVPATTKSTYKSAWRAWMQWCQHHGRPCMPIVPEDLSVAVAEWADSYALATIEVRVAAIAFHHRLAEAQLPVRERTPSPAQDPKVQMTLRAVRRRLGRAPQRQMAPISTADLRRLVEALNGGLAGVRDRALLLVGFAGALRRSELAGLRAEDVTEQAEGLRVVIRQSKTDQEGVGQVIGLPRASDGVLCPVRAYNNWLWWSGITTGPVFRRIDRHGNIGDRALTPPSVNLRLRAACRAAGMPNTLVARMGGHSLRSGFATEAARAGASERSIAKTTRHKSMDTLRRYIREGTLFEDNAASRILG